jgi:hypothetical protein
MKGAPPQSRDARTIAGSALAFRLIDWISVWIPAFPRLSEEGE